MFSCESREVQKLYLETGNVICIPEGPLPQDQPGFGDDQNRELGNKVIHIKGQYAESSLHSDLGRVLQKKVGGILNNLIYLYRRHLAGL
jgi:hypothetical protein